MENKIFEDSIRETMNNYIKDYLEENFSNKISVANRELSDLQTNIKELEDKIKDLKKELSDIVMINVIKKS